jgi:hypothetical protein
MEYQDILRSNINIGVTWMLSLLKMDMTYQIHTDYEQEKQCQHLLIWVGVGHISCAHVSSLLFDMFDKWIRNNQSSTSFVRLGMSRYYGCSFQFLSAPDEVCIHGTRTVLFVANHNH